jgi:ABC-type lipopolysaccharide export system ATPase subunit
VLFKRLAQWMYRTKDKPGLHDGIDGMELLDKVIDIDQSPIGRTPRSNPATYTTLFTHIRELFASLPDAKLRGYTPGRFSFNVKGGRCEACQGDGIIQIEMQFLPDVYVPCEVCHGLRYNRETLQIRYKGKNIAEVLDLTVEAAMDFFANIPAIRRKLETLYDVGLGYIRLGQPATTLSGGEAQRVKLSKELSRRSTGKTLYILDEPTTGLHFADIEKLLAVLEQLVDNGNTVVVIEHNLDVIKCADWIIDLGPEGGDKGGYVVAAGTPEQVMQVSHSYTGQWLQHVLNGRHLLRAAELARDVHPGALVEPGGAGGVLRVDAQVDAPLAAPVELAKGVVQQRQSQPHAPPRATHAQLADPAVVWVGVAQRPAGDLVSVHSQEPQVRLKVLALHHTVVPYVVAPGQVAPMIPERVFHGVESGAIVLPRCKDAHGDARRPLGRGRRSVQHVDLHAPKVAR